MYEKKEVNFMTKKNKELEKLLKDFQLEEQQAATIMEAVEGLIDTYKKCKESYIRLAFKTVYMGSYYYIIINCYITFCNLETITR